nr:hypothetical protein [uncultured Ilyobacter sp.]
MEVRHISEGKNVPMKIKPEIMMTHASGYMFITDMKNQKFSVL